jgi:hypothetical protein
MTYQQTLIGIRRLAACMHPPLKAEPMEQPRLQQPPTLANLGKAIADLEVRIAAIEKHLGLVDAARSRPTPHGVTGTTAVQSAPTARASLQLSALGMAVLMLAGAFLLRALTDTGFLNATVGVSLGVVYVLALFMLTDRAAVDAQRPRAVVFGLASVLVAFPFLWETTSQLGLLSTSVAAILTGLVTVLGLGVALRHRLLGLAWFVLVSALATCVALYWAAGASALFVALVVALGVITVWLGYLQDWQGPQWLVASGANLLVLLTALLAARSAEGPPPGPLPSVEAVLPLALALPVLYLGSFFLYTLRLRREVGVFEIAQSTGCLLVGYLGTIILLNHGGSSTAPLGWISLVIAVACYTLAFTVVQRLQDRGRNFFYYLYLGLLLTLAGTALFVPARWLPFVWGMLGVSAAMSAGQNDRWTLRLHCAVYLIGAAALSGIPTFFFKTLASSTTTQWRDLGGPAMATWLLTIICYTLLATTQRDRNLTPWQSIPRFLLAGLVIVGGDSLLVAVLTGWLTGWIPGPAAAMVAAIRTGVLAVTTVGLAAASRRGRLVELSWFVNPLLILTGLKLLFIDLRNGTPVSLFFGFALFGIALILAPRLRPRQRGIRGSDHLARGGESPLEP